HRTGKNLSAFHGQNQPRRPAAGLLALIGKIVPNLRKNMHDPWRSLSRVRVTWGRASANWAGEHGSGSVVKPVSWKGWATDSLHRALTMKVTIGRLALAATL